MPRLPRKPARTLVLAVLALVLAGQPGCLVGSPLAAISGRLYGMTRDDVAAIRGTDKNAIWKGLPALAVIDIPFAFVLDTGFLPIALIFAGFDLLIGDEDHGHGTGPGQHTHDDEKDADEDEEKPHTHEDGTTHTHGAGEGHDDPDAREAARERDAKATRERLERERLEREDAERRRKDEAREEAMRGRAAGQPTDQERREADLRREREELDAERARLAREREAFERERGGVAPVASPTPR